MQTETRRLLIRDIETDDAIPFAAMAADGTLNDCGFGKDCCNWIDAPIMKTSGKPGLPILSGRSIETMVMLPKRLQHIRNIS